MTALSIALHCALRCALSASERKLARFENDGHCVLVTCWVGI